MSAGLGLSLNNALTGLRVNQRNISVLSHNIANVNTVGYSRQTVNQQAVVIEGVGSGVQIDDVVRTIDKYLQRAMIGQQSELSRSDVVDEFHERLQILLGEPGSDNSLDEYVSTFFNSLQQLAETPERTSFRTNALEAGVTLAREVSKLAYEVENLRFEADREIGQAVNSVNDILRRLDTVNVAIVRAYTLNQPTADLLDQRDGMVNQLAGYIDITTFYEETGRVNVLTAGGISIVDGTPHALQYSPLVSAQNFVDDGTINQLSVVTLDSNGVARPNPQVLISGGDSSAITTPLTGGSIKGLQQLRDDVLPGMLDMLDMMISRLRDNINAIHNDGSSFPGKNQLTGTREVAAADQYTWSGSVRIAVLTADGQPAISGYNDETYTGIRPLTLNLSALDSGQGLGKPKLQTIIDEINNHFRAPPVKAKVGTLNNIQLASQTDYLPNVSDPNFRFDLDIDNISGDDTQVFVTGFTVLDSLGVNITNVTQAAPQVALNATNTYTTSLGSNNVFVEVTGLNSFAQGDTIFLSPPAGAVNGLTTGQLSGYFQIVSAVGNTVEIVVAGAPAGATGSVSDGSGVYLQNAYDTIDAGEKRRTTEVGGFAVDLSGNTTSQYYDISVDVASVAEDGTLVSSTITYRVMNGTTNMLNDRYDNTAVSGGGQRIVPTKSQESIRAIMVDANGLELPKVNGQYVNETGFLKLVSNTGLSIAIDELDSKQVGNLDTYPISGQTNRGFSHYFGLNNFFEDNLEYGETVNLKNSAFELAVEADIINNPNLISVGGLELQNQPTNENELPQWTYVRFSGNNAIAQKLAGFANETTSFDAVGGLPSTSLTIGGYISELLGSISAEAAAATGAFTSAETLYNGFAERAQGISGVNLDEELANTITYQNAYTANARVISLVNQLFDDLLNVLG